MCFLIWGPPIEQHFQIQALMCSIGHVPATLLQNSLKPVKQTRLANFRKKWGKKHFLPFELYLGSNHDPIITGQNAHCNMVVSTSSYDFEVMSIDQFFKYV